MKYSNAALGFVLHKSRRVSLAIARNLARSAGRHCAVPNSRSPDRSHGYNDALILGAGPSLRHALPYIAETNAWVYTVNSAVAAVCPVRTPDYTVIREIVSALPHIKDHDIGWPILDLGCAPEVFDHYPYAQVFASELQSFELCQMLGVSPIGCGPSALTAAVALAYARGSERIMIAGASLSYGKDGAAYASGTPWQAVKVASVADGKAQLDGNKVLQDHCVANGMPADPDQRSVYEVPAIGGGTVLSQQTWVEQIHWLERFAATHDDVKLYDASGEGALKRGWEVIDPSSITTLKSWAGGIGPEITQERVEMAKARLRRQCEAARQFIHTVAHPEGYPLAVPFIEYGTDLVDAVCAGELLALNERVREVGDPMVGIMGQVDVYERACADIEAAIA